MNKLHPANPKLRRRTNFGRAHWYPYYAGYSTEFVESALKIIKPHKNSIILDPWNGSGTTTTVCSSLGYPSIGYDLNPIMAIVAKARLLADDVAPSLPSLLEVILAQPASDFRLESDDPILEFFGRESARAIRTAVLAIRRTLVGDPSARTCSTIGYANVSSLAAFFLVVLFRTVRRAASAYQSTNPTWLRIPKGEARRATLSWHTLGKFMREELRALTEGDLTPYRMFPGRAAVTLSIANSRKLPLDSASIDALITSPPYCTRIDYAVATRLELAVLGEIGQIEFTELRRNLLGTTLSSNAALESLIHKPGDTANQVLAAIKSHTSKASGSYYLRTYVDYFRGLRESIGEIARVLRSKGSAVVVVQDSYYKEVHVNLVQIVEEMAAQDGMRLTGRWDFISKQTMRRVHPYASNKAKQTSPIESVLQLSRE